MSKARKKNSIAQSITTFIQGIALGTAEIIPGVSGSTIALLFGIYDDFIDLLYQASELVKLIAMVVLNKKKIQHVLDQIKKIHWKFGILLLTGMITAIGGLSSVITILLEQYPMYLFAFLIGLTPPTMLIVFRQMNKPKVSEAIITTITAGSLLTLFIGIGENFSITNPHPAHLFFGGMVAISAMVLPGVSGSFMLLILGLYHFVIGLISDVVHGQISFENISLLFILASGIIVGFLTTVRILRYAIDHYRNQLMAFLLGLLISSWYVLWPFVQVVGFEEDNPILGRINPFTLSTAELLLVITTAAVTASLVTWLHWWSDTHDETPHTLDDSITKL